MTTAGTGKRKLVNGINRIGAWIPGGDFQSFDAEKLIAQACRLADYAEFGEMHPAEPLAVLFDSYQRESKLSFIGRIAMRQDALTMLVNRLKIEKKRAATPAIAAEPIHQPVFILGLPRTGTTLLHNLLSQDPQHRSPLGWETMYPEVPTTAREAERLIKKAQSRSAWLDWLAPTVRVMHEVDMLQPQECIQITGHTFESYLFETLCHVPSYQRWLAKRDLTPSYRFHQRMLQHFQYGQHTPTWVLKAPAHLFAINALLAVYPDARIIQTHRDPLQVIPSLASLVYTLRCAFSDAVDRSAVGKEIASHWSQALDQATRDRDLHTGTAHVWVDLSYERLVREPLAAMEQLYADAFGRNLDGETADRMRQFLAASPRHKFGKHHYSPEDFLLDPDMLSQRFHDYCERFNVLPGTS
ncbi:MAG: sulfotransferase [Pseudomonadales bacterium]|nr:sulfotransferase [Pseudomonadales bacterium]